MPTVEDYFDDDTDLPLPAASSSRPRALQGSGHRGALLEEIHSDEEEEVPDPSDAMDLDMDFSKLADQSRGIFGENAKAPPPGAGPGKGKLAVRDDPGELRPSASGAPGGPQFNPNSMMGGFMGDMMKLQAAEEERLERVRKQFGTTTVADPGVYKGWNSLYPIYFDAKVSINDGRRVSRKDALWWPQATQISKACRTLGLPCVLEPESTHPADWENPGRVKVQFAKDGRFYNPIIKNRAQLCKHLASQMQQAHPDLAYRSKPTKSAPAADTSRPRAKSKMQSKSTKAASTSASSARPPRLPSRPPRPPIIPPLDDRLPLHSPIAPTGVAVTAMKRDMEAEKEAKKKAVTSGGEDKAPKMKKVFVKKR